MKKGNSTRIPIATAFVLFLLLRFVLFDLLTVEGDSMLPGLQSGTLLLISKISYTLPLLQTRTGSIHRNDVIVYEETNGNLLVKRVIGIPGDQLRVQNGRILINGKPELSGIIPGGKPVVPESKTLQPGEYWLAGDNRAVSRDSRDFGPVSAKSIIGKALLKVWPPAKIGSVN